jgi:hypothetical protein
MEGPSHKDVSALLTQVGYSMPSPPIQFSYEADLANIRPFFCQAKDPLGRPGPFPSGRLIGGGCIVYNFMCYWLINFMVVPLSFELPTLLINISVIKGLDNKVAR